MFSPYYAWARRHGRGDPLHHCALNVALYGTPARWTMTERGRDAVTREDAILRIGPSALRWDGTALDIDLAETAAPIPRPVRGTVRVTPGGMTDRTYCLDTDRLHRWSPLASASRIEVRMESPALSWSGDAYLDSNEGDAPIEESFSQWHWSRGHSEDGARVYYDATQRDGVRTEIGIDVARDGTVRPAPLLPLTEVPRGLWKVRRTTRADAGAAVRVLRKMEDAPFYARSVLETLQHGEPARIVHESLDMDRFTAPVVQAMLPFRIPRAGFFRRAPR